MHSPNFDRIACHTSIGNAFINSLRGTFAAHRFRRQSTEAIQESHRL